MNRDLFATVPEADLAGHPAETDLLVFEHMDLPCCC